VKPYLPRQAAVEALASDVLQKQLLQTTESAVHKHNTQPLYGYLDFVRDNPGEPVPEETFTHSHLSWSSIVPYLLLPSHTIHGDY